MNFYKNIFFCFVNVSPIYYRLNLSLWAGAKEKSSTDYPQISVYAANRRILEDQTPLIDSVTYVPLRAYSEITGERIPSAKDDKKGKNRFN